MKINLINQEVIPVLLGVDMNAYGMARSFYEKYKIRSLVLGQEAFFHTQNTKILDFEAVPNLQDEKVFTKTLLDIAKRFKGKKIFLLPTAEVYVEPVVNNKKELDKYFIIPSIEKDLLYDLVRKDKFQDLCAKYDIPVPETIIATYDNYKDIDYDFKFGYPMVIKPNNSRTYFRARFNGKKKAYVIDSKEEAIEVVNNIYENSDYRDELIIQEFIPGEDENMRLISCYSDRHGKLKNITLTHVLLEDHAPGLIGNPVTHIIEKDKYLFDKFSKLLNDLKYVGFSNIDLKYDSRDKKIKAFDFNARLGRSSYHVTASGYNIAKLIMDDYIYHKELDLVYNDHEYLWTAIPVSIIYKYVSNEKLLKKARELIKAGKYSRSLFYDKDMSIIRRLKLARMDNAYYNNFKTNYIKR